MSLPSPEPLASEALDPQGRTAAALALPAAQESALGEIGVGIAAAFLATRALMSTTLVEQAAPGSEGATKALLTQIWLRNRPVWVAMVLPSLQRAYTLGAVPTALSISEQQLLAQDYARTLGDALHETSAQALVEGYYGQLRNGFSERLAWERAAHGYGLDGNQFSAWVRAIINEPRSIVGTTLSAVSRASADRFFLARADRIGRTESYHAMQVGKSVFWLMAQANGDLPADTRKRWVTARDEKVCPVCGPLDGVEVLLAERFTLPTASLWAPGAHPNCRCEIELVYTSTVVIPDDASELLGDYVMAKRLVPIAKADYGRTKDGDRYYNVRDAEGQWAKRSERAKPKAQTAFIDEQSQEVLELLEQLAAIEQEQVTADPFAKPVDPFAKPVDPFAQTADPFVQTADPFVAADPLVKDPITDTQDAFALDPFARTRRVRRFIILNGVPQMVEEEVEVRDEGVHDESVYMFGSGFLHGYESYLQRHPEAYEPGLRGFPTFVGAEINLDYDELDRPEDTPAGMPASLDDPQEPGWAIEDILKQEGAEYVSHAARTARQAQRHSQGLARMNEEWDMAYSDVASMIDAMSEEWAQALINRAVRSGGEPMPNDWLDEGRTVQEWLYAQYSSENDVAYAGVIDTEITNWIADNARAGFAFDELDSTVEDEISPTIFKFEGFRGAYVDSKWAPTGIEAFVEGRYIVKSVEFKNVNPETRKRITDQGDEDFRRYRLITLVPKPEEA